jgi:MFS family permease
VGTGLPQLVIARYIVRFERKKWWFVVPGIPMRVALLIFAGAVVWLDTARPGAILLAFLICYGMFSFGNGVVIVPWSDLVGTSLDNRWRARLFGLINAGAAVILLGAAPLIGVVLSDAGPAYPHNYALLFGAAGALFALTILPTVLIHELPGGKAVEKLPALREFLPSLGRVLRRDAPFRTVVITRLLTTLFAMAGPFYIGFATVRLGLSSTVAVPTLLAMQTLGTVTGGLLYTWLGARDNLLFIRLALAAAAGLPISALLAGLVGPLPLIVGFLVSGLTSGSLFDSYQNWVITYAPPDQRPIYVGLFNTVVAVMSLIAPFIAGTIAQYLGYEPLFLVALVMIVGALFVALRYIQNPRAAAAHQRLPAAEAQS